MAKRRKLEAPSLEDLNQIEEQVRDEVSRRNPMGAGGVVAPIAQVVADSAALSQTASVEERAEQARIRTQADKLEQAENDGRLLSDLPLEQIEADAMIRDRTILDEAEMMELRLSISANGLRLPVEVYELAEPRADGVRYGLLSGYRRLMAVQALKELTEQEKYDTIRAIIRPRATADAAFVAMVEENEVRAELSHFERGRISVIAAQQGAFTNVEDAVDRLFATGSKAKRSKVRSFAMIFEELGDMLEFPEALTERRGLRIAQALRHGTESRLRDALADRTPADPDEEWSFIEPVLAKVEANPRSPSAGGRPRTGARISGWANADTLHTSAGITIRKQRDNVGFLLRFEGKRLDDDLMESLMQEIRALLESP